MGVDIMLYQKVQLFLPRDHSVLGGGHFILSFEGPGQMRWGGETALITYLANSSVGHVQHMGNFFNSTLHDISMWGGAVMP